MDRLMTSCCPASQNLLRFLTTWKKSSQLDIDLANELDSFLMQLSDQQQDRDNYTANDFAEVAIFVQNYAQIYDKKVDLLLKQFLQLHITLCDISSKPSNENEGSEPSTSGINTKNEQTNNEEKTKRKRKKVEVPENVPLEQAPIITEQENPVVDPFTKKELAEIGTLWKQLNKIERHKIENIINNLDENDGIESSNEESAAATDITNNTQVTTVECHNKTMTQDSGVDLGCSLLDENAADDITTDSADDNIPADDSAASNIAADDITADDRAADNIAADDITADDIAADNTAATNIEKIQEMVSDINLDEPTDQKLNDELSCDKHIEKSEETKLEILKEVQIRLKRLTESDIFEYASKRNKIVDSYKKNDESCEPGKACLDCTGCTALTHILIITNTSSEVSKKEISMDIAEKYALRKRHLKQDTVMNKKTKLDKGITVSALEFDNFYENCYDNINYEDGKLIVDIKKLKNKENSDINANNIELDEVDESDIEVNEVDENGSDIDENDIELDEVDENDIEVDEVDENGTKLNEVNENEIDNICASILNSIIDNITSDNTEDINIRFSRESGFCENFFEDSHETETQNEIDFEKQSLIDKELESISKIQHNSEEMELANINPSTSIGNVDGLLSPSSFFPHTPAYSEDSGRFSSAAYHSDIEGENIIRTIHNDSGVETSHQSDDEDDNASGVSQFKSLDPSSLVYYKKKCESLLEQRERDKKMKEWENFLKEKEATNPKLSEFHINEYETKILDSLPEDSKKSVSFDSLVKGKPPQEVARFFAATLQLANMDNVFISDNTIKEESPNNTFKVTLKSKERYYENIDAADSFMNNISSTPLFTSTPFKTPKSKTQRFRK